MYFNDNGLLGNDPDIYYNSLGHRCREVDDINLRKYILFAGDNFGLGLDKPIEQTFPYITAQKSNMDYYNLCLFNGGLDGMKYNLVMWSKLFESTPPKAIILANEFLNSLLISDNNFSFIKPGDINDPMINEMLSAANVCGYFLGKHVLAGSFFANLFTIPVFQLIPKGRQILQSDSIVNVEFNEEVFDHEKVADIFTTLLEKRNTRIAP